MLKLEYPNFDGIKCPSEKYFNTLIRNQTFLIIVTFTLIKTNNLRRIIFLSLEVFSLLLTYHTPKNIYRLLYNN